MPAGVDDFHAGIEQRFDDYFGALVCEQPGAFGANGTFIYSTSGTFVGSILAGTTHVSGAANTGRVELTGGLIFAA